MPRQLDQRLNCLERQVHVKEPQWLLDDCLVPLDKDIQLIFLSLPHAWLHVMSIARKCCKPTLQHFMVALSLRLLRYLLSYRHLEFK